VALALAAYLGGVRELHTWVPQTVLFPVIVFVGLETVSHSLRVIPTRHYPAVGLAAVPVVAYLALITVRLALGNRAPDTAGAALTQTLLCLANGFVITSVFWAGALTTLLDGQRCRSANFFLLAGVCSLIGLIHSPLPDAPLALPTPARLDSLPRAATYQTPYHWAASYALAAAVVYFWPRTTRFAEGEEVVPALREPVKAHM